MLFSILLSEVALHQISGGLTVVLTHLCYFPVVILAFRYPRRGALIATITGLGYLALLGLLTYPDPDLIAGIMQFYVYVIIGVIVSSLASDLQQNEMKYHSIFNNSADCTLLVNVTTGEILDANRICADMVAGCADRSNQCSLAYLWPDTAERTAFLEEVQRNTSVSGREIRIGRNDRVMYVLLSAAMLADGIAVMSLTDISEKKAIELALRQSERRFRELTELLPLPVFEADTEGRITFANLAAFETYGYPVEALTEGIGMLDLIVPQDRDRVRENLVHVYRDHMVVREYTALTKSGKRFPVVIHASSIRNGTEILGIRGIAIDVTEERNTQQVIRESEALYRTIFDNTGAATAIVGDNGRILLANHEFSLLLDYPQDSMTGMKMTDCVAAVDRDRVRSYHQRRQADPRDAPRNYEMQFVRRGGDQLYCSVTVAHIPGTERYVVSLLDITERQRFFDALQEANKKLSILSGITRHDILNQITAIRWYIELIRESVAGNAAIVPSINRVMECVDTVSRQIMFTRMYEEIGIAAPRWQHIETVMRTAWEQLPSADVPLELSADGLEVYADPLLERVFFNLMDNSLRHGEQVTRFTVSFTTSGEDGRLLFEDDGVGVPADIKGRIFSRNFGKNTGFGLFLSRDILGITGITIRETGTEGTGACFEMTIPNGHYRFVTPDNDS